MCIILIFAQQGVGILPKIHPFFPEEYYFVFQMLRGSIFMYPLFFVEYLYNLCICVSTEVALIF